MRALERWRERRGRGAVRGWLDDGRRGEQGRARCVDRWQRRAARRAVRACGARASGGRHACACCAWSRPGAGARERGEEQGRRWAAEAWRGVAARCAERTNGGRGWRCGPVARTRGRGQAGAGRAHRGKAGEPGRAALGACGSGAEEGEGEGRKERGRGKKKNGEKKKKMGKKMEKEKWKRKGKKEKKKGGRERERGRFAPR